MNKNAIRGDRVKQLRDRHGLTQKDLAQAAFVSQSYLSEIENSGQDSVGSIVVLGLARALHTSTDYLVGASDDPSPREDELGLSEWEFVTLRNMSVLTEDDRETVNDMIASLARRRSGR